jgi:FtsH-binding integral membrane protein
MSERYTFATTNAVGAEYDQGLRSYMLGIYNYMGGALALTGILAFLVANTPFLVQTIFGTPLQYVVMLAPLGIVFYLSAKIHNMPLKTAQTWFWGFAGLMGVSLASIFLVYTGESVARVFFITSITFCGMSLYGYTTKKDLSSMGSFLIMGVFGLIVAGLINLFMQSSALQFAISLIGVVIFTGLTAFSTQKIKHS